MRYSAEHIRDCFDLGAEGCRDGHVIVVLGVTRGTPILTIIQSSREHQGQRNVLIILACESGVSCAGAERVVAAQLRLRQCLV